MAIAIIAVLCSLVFASARGMLMKAKQAKCASNLRQVGTAIIAYTQEYNGEFPLTTHSLDSATLDQAWVYRLSEYLADVDEVRICPADPKGKLRLEENGTSYLLNSFLTVPQLSPFGEKLGGYTNLNSIPSAARTPVAFPINFSRGTGQTNDHTHSEGWRSWEAVRKDIQPDCFRFGGQTEDGLSGTANYLFVDGHVENIPARRVHEWITSGYNFADPAAHPNN